MLNIGERLISIQDYYDVLFKNEKVAIHSEAAERIKKSYSFLESFHKNKIIYGINTGLGPMAQYKIDESDRVKLHYNAIRSHASGSGRPVDPIYVRSAMITLLSNFSHGFSGMHPEVIDLLRELVNLNIVPVVPEHGGVGQAATWFSLHILHWYLSGRAKYFMLMKLCLRPGY